MYVLLDSNIITLMIIIGSVMVTPLYIFATYVFSGASKQKGILISLVFLLCGSFMSWVCLSDTPNKIGPIGQLIVPAAWFLPSLILFWKQDWFLSQPLSQKWLIGLQVFRVIGSVFLIEMMLGHIPGIFAYPAGVGDIVVGLLAATTLLLFKEHDQIPKKYIFAVLTLGILDFLSAFFFGFTSSESSLQLFFPEITNQSLLFPIGMIPLYLVPYAIFFHMLSFLNYMKFERQEEIYAGT